MVTLPMTQSGLPVRALTILLAVLPAILLAILGVILEAGLASLSAETMEDALARSYRNTPELNAQRAQVRSVDENVPQALSGYRPTVTLTGNAGYQYRDLQRTGGGTATDYHGTNTPRGAALTVSQTLFNGDQTANRTRAAETQVLAAREVLRSVEQSVLLSAATAYMDYLRDAASLEVQKANVRVLERTATQARDRFRLGEITYTDVAQSEAQLAAGRTQQRSAESQLATSKANFRRCIGDDPVNPAPGSPVDRFLPGSLRAATEIALVESPDIASAVHGIDADHLQVRINEGALLPTVALQASVQQSYDTYEQSTRTYRSFGAAAALQASIPISQGGDEYALVRQSKERLARQQLALDSARDQVRATVAERWARLATAKAQLQSTEAQVSASEIALNGVRNEAKDGQRTTLDFLNAQLALVNARVSLVTAQHDRVIASYGVLGAIGRLSPRVLGLRTAIHDPGAHYLQVRDRWFGTEAPDAR
jgi:outer membrane protein